MSLVHSPVKLWRNQKHTRHMIGQTGTILTWTLVRVPPDGFSDQAPYSVVLVELSGGARVSCQLVDGDGQSDLFGQRVELVVRRVVRSDADGVIPYGIKARLMHEEARI